jgi:hypothetical protein
LRECVNTEKNPRILEQYHAAPESLIQEILGCQVFDRKDGKPRPAWWFMPRILTTWESEIRRIVVSGQ